VSTPSQQSSLEQVSDDLASALAQMTQVLLAVQTGDTVVNLVTALAVKTLPGTVGAGVTLVSPQGKPGLVGVDLDRAQGSSSHLARGSPFASVTSGGNGSTKLISGSRTSSHS